MGSPSCVQAVMLDIKSNNEEDWTPTKIEINSWVSLMPGKRGGHAKDAWRHGGSSISGSYKARVLQFRLNASSTNVTEILVQHAYMQRQLLDLKKEERVISGGANYLYLSEYEDWIDTKSVIGIITVVHADIGEMYRVGRTHKDLLNDSLFFYNARYYPRTGQQQYGRIEPILLPNFNDPIWPLPDMLTSEIFRAKMRCDFLASLKPNTGSRQTHLQWFMPITIMVDLFSCATTIHRTKTLFVFKVVTNTLMSSLMDSGWDSKVSAGVDVIRCTIDLATITFRFHISRSTLYTNFQFNRERYLLETGWQPIDQVGHVDIVSVHCEYNNWKFEIEVGKDWQLINLRQEIIIALGAECPEEFSLWIVEPGQVTQKVNRRNEGRQTAADVLLPRRLQIVLK